MASSGSMVVLVLTLMCMFLGLAGVLAGAIGEAWYVRGPVKIGLWRTCAGSICKTYKDVFTFDEGTIFFKFAIVLLLLTISAIMSFFGGVSTFFMFCCQRSPGAWRCCAVWISIVTMLGAVSALGGVGYNEYFGKDVYKGYDHGWSSIIAWVGAVLQFVGSIMAYIMICNAPNTVVGGIVIHPGHQNKGYEMH